MHSTDVRLLRSAVPLGLLVLSTTAVSGQTFKAEGTVSMTYPDKLEGIEIHDIFTAFVDGAKWLIRTTDTGTNIGIAFHEAAFNGTDRFLYLDGKAKDPGVITANMNILITQTPEADISLTAPVWFALASADYFRRLTNSSHLTLPWIDGRRERKPNSAATGRWKFTDQPSPVLREAVFYDTFGSTTGAYKDGFLRQRYSVVRWTNLNGQMLPLEAVLQEYGPKLLRKDGKVVRTDGKVTFAGKDRDDVEETTRYRVVVNRYELGVKPVRFEPTPQGDAVVDDYRFLSPNQTPKGFLRQYLLSDQQNATNGAVRFQSR